MFVKNLPFDIDDPLEIGWLEFSDDDQLCHLNC